MEVCSRQLISPAYAFDRYVRDNIDDGLFCNKMNENNKNPVEANCVLKKVKCTKSSGFNYTMELSYSCPENLQHVFLDVTFTDSSSMLPTYCIRIH